MLFGEMVILAVENYPIIYDMGHSLYTHRAKKEEAFKENSENLSIECQKKISDNY